jgi:hypothetical protein
MSDVQIRDLEDILEDIVTGIIGYFIDSSLLIFGLTHFGLISSSGPNMLEALFNVFVMMCVIIGIRGVLQKR